MAGMAADQRLSEAQLGESALEPVHHSPCERRKGTSVPSAPAVAIQCVAQSRERPRAVSEYPIECITIGGATRLCCANAPGQLNIMVYYAVSIGRRLIRYAAQPGPAGLCDAVS
jgi:hypothetical protein